MANSNIILRGISRNPSERNNPDGACSESLNVVLRDGEVACALKPKTTLSTSEQIDAFLYIHKTPNFTAYIAKTEQDEIGYTYDGNTFTTLVTFDNSEDITCVSSIGNTLIVATNLSTYYFVYEKGAYKSVQGQILEGPDIAFYEKDTTQDYSFGVSSLVSTDNWPTLDVNNYNLIIDKRNSLRTINKLFSSPVFMMAAYKLANGDYVQGVPQLVGYKSFSEMVLKCSKTLVPHSEEEDDRWQYSVVTKVRGFNIGAKLFNKSKIKELGSLVQSVDILMSNDVSFWTSGTVTDKVEFVKTISTDEAIYDYEDKRVENALLNASIFRVVKSISATDDEALSKLENGWTLDISDYIDPDLRATLPYVETDIACHHKITLSNMSAYNNRLIASESARELSSGSKFIPAPSKSSESNNLLYKFVFHITTASGSDKIVYGRNWIDSVDMNDQSYPTPMLANGFILYPDTRCSKVEIYIKNGSTTRKVVIGMYEHPSLNYSYGFAPKGFRHLTLNEQPAAPLNYPSPENRKELVNNTIYLTETDNPFAFTANGTQSFSDEVVGFSTITKPLSQGQFGQYDIYVFTKGGIWALGIAQDGSIANVKPLSQDVALAGTISQIDQAIVFTTERGVMLLTGSDIQCISEEMTGKPMPMTNTEVLTMLDDNDFGDYSDIISDDTTFMEFMRSANCIYDYAGKRLIFFNKEVDYQYVYLIGTGTWHKLYIGTIMYSNVINSYPNACISCYKDGKERILDFSTHYGTADDDDALPGVIVTRSIKLSTPDTYKSLSKILLRGDYESGAVKYIVLGSRDNKEFHVLRSLRGPSWKYFKLVILTNLLPDDRLAYIETWYEDRFLNKPR